MVSWFCRTFSCGIITTAGSYNPLFLSSAGFPKLCLTFDCRSLHLLPTAARLSISEDHDPLHSAPVQEYSRILFGVISLTYLYFRGRVSLLVFVPILGLRAIHTLSLALQEMSGMAWVKDWTCHWWSMQQTLH